LDETGEHAVLQGWRGEMFGRDAVRLIRGEIALGAKGKRVMVGEVG